METGDIYRQKNRPTLQQLRYLEELQKLGNGRGIMAQIAEACGVNHSSVVRYLKNCVENEILESDYSFTQKGKAYLEGYLSLIEELRQYLYRIGIPEREIEENVRDMIENMDYYTIASMLRNDQKIKSIYSVERKENISRNFISEVLQYGNCKVRFMICRMEGEERGISMADRGFEKPATVRHNKRGSWLELKIRDMKAHSRVNGQNMVGHMESLKYEMDGALHAADIRDNTVRIPLTACRYHCRQGGEIRGMVPVTLSCSVGRTHMPESTAMLVFWM